ncbi:right-handed parallel beta-helix repeat-containing protein [Microbacterium sp. cx-59]|uniref:right-handed parallel beta-helix repeat-containing protein n=1 Tax=Microbacterium sp. cx-59 TaxID=2891207 RepID=UPI001E412EFB|nr:right-handed parallel beta-helix repeat-containing protein [Microbacterium sp. cx-59]MCC4909162.1 right-handed parallel beta-helix repeat-containing protein [Microbacterium sp. cx-59]
MTGLAHLRRVFAPTLVAAVLLLAGCTATAASPDPDAAPSGSATPSASATPDNACAPGARLVGDTPKKLQAALDAAEPGDVLQLADVTYTGSFTIRTSGTEAAPIILCGTSGSALEGKGATSAGIVLRLTGASYWTLENFAVRSAHAGIVLDDASSNQLRKLSVSDIGGQGIRLRSTSAHNMIVDSTIRDTGITDRDMGEGIAVGSRESSWCQYSECEPDRSDATIIVSTTVDHTAGEAISAEEGTSSGVIRDNWLSRGDGTSSDSVVDLKGNGWIFAQNEVGDAAGPGVQVHSFMPEWGLNNRIVTNKFGGSADELAIQVIGVAALTATEVGCNNAMTWGPPARTNIECT